MDLMGEKLFVNLSLNSGHIKENPIFISGDTLYFVLFFLFYALYTLYIFNNQQSFFSEAKYSLC